MYSSEDLERFYFQYKTKALPHGVSIQDFCVRNKVPYNIFSKWDKDTRKQIVEVTVDGRLSEEGEASGAPSHSRQQYFSDCSALVERRTQSIGRLKQIGFGSWRSLLRELR